MSGWSIGMIIPNIRTNKKCSNHQPNMSWWQNHRKKHVDFPAFPCDKQPYHLTRIAGQGQLSLEISLVLDIS